MAKRHAVYRFVAGVIVLSALAGAPSLARAADEAPGSKIHGFFDLSLKNDYITPRGLLVTDTGQTVLILIDMRRDFLETWRLRRNARERCVTLAVTRREVSA